MKLKNFSWLMDWGKKLFVLVLFSFTIIVVPAYGAEKKPQGNLEYWQNMIKLLKPLHKKLGKPQSGDWLSIHDEPGQTFEEYLVCNPVLPDRDRNVIYIQPIGDFKGGRKKVLMGTANFLSLFFGLPVVIRDSLPLSVVPESARRKHPAWGMDQLLSTYIIHDVLKPRLPKNAVFMIGLTPVDLWPGKGWNFVFGQASLRERVGVWSIYRNGDPDGSEESFKLCLLRTIQTAAHECCHMFSMRHCTAYECLMCGSNSRQESDSRPLVMCPECLAKLCYATRADPVKRFKKLSRFAQKYGLNEQKKFYDKSLQRLLEGERKQRAKGK